MKIEDIELCATYWTVSGAVYPGAPSEVSPFPLKDRAEISGRIGWRGMGFVLDDMEASIARYGMPTVRRIFADNGIRHVELEFLCDWHLDGEKRRASDRMYDRLLEVGAELGIGKIKVGGGVFEEGEPDIPAMRATFAALCERAAPSGSTSSSSSCPSPASTRSTVASRSSKASAPPMAGCWSTLGTSIAAA